jgi:phosphoglycolate phosphatase
VEHFGLVNFFDGLYGAELEGRFDDKGDLIGHIMEVEGIEPGRTVMIGDRHHDVVAAARHAIPCIGAVWGYGGLDELTTAGAARLCDRPHQLSATVGELLGVAR